MLSKPFNMWVVLRVEEGARWDKYPTIVKFIYDESELTDNILHYLRLKRKYAILRVDDVFRITHDSHDRRVVHNHKGKNVNFFNSTPGTFIE